ncbi:MAG TPA: hypothetical protein VHU83_06295 [Bryobacteraceae bacterium]|nr:hypothetical protein [Bryobacteraceae bacterium]
MREFLGELGKQYGSIGGKRAAENMTAEQRSERARNAVAAREAKKAAANSAEVRSKDAATKKRARKNKPKQKT